MQKLQNFQHLGEIKIKLGPQRRDVFLPTCLRKNLMIKYVTKCAICVDCLVYGTNPASNINCCRILRFYLDIVMGKVRLFELVIKGGVFEK